MAPNRDERLFLVLSIFIGVISGLMVVCFRVAISWIQVLTLGSSPHPGQFRLFFVPMGIGLLVAVLVQLVFPGARGSGINQTKAALYIYNGYISFRTVMGKFITAGSGHRWWIFAGTRRPVAANRGGCGLDGQPPAESLAGTVAHVCARLAPLRAWRRRSTLPSPPFCLSWKR